MRDLYHLLETVAATSSTVLITGETGTGKELAARAIHHSSPRRANRFVAINCSAIPETLLEAELFGHVRGAFTGAVGTRQGRLEQAHKGTLFLDEVGTMSPALQAKLLRVLQEREFERVGDSHTIKIDVRVIAATHSDLARMVADGTFREDLFYRLNVIPVQLPPLRERRDDIPLLVQHFLQKLCARCRAAATVTVSQDALRRLMAYSLARQRAAAREHRRARAGVQPGPTADRRRRISRPEIQNEPAPADASEVWLPDEGLDFETLHRRRRAVAHPPVARADAGQQAAGGEAPEPETHDAHREAEASRTADRAPQSCHNRRYASAARLLDDHRRRKADGLPRADAGRAAADLRQLQARHPDAVMKWFARGRLWESQEVERADAAARRRPPAGDRPPSGDGAGATGGRAANTRIRAIGSRSRATRSGGGSRRTCIANVPVAPRTRETIRRRVQLIDRRLRRGRKASVGLRSGGRETTVVTRSAGAGGRSGTAGEAGVEARRWIGRAQAAAARW